MLPLLPIQKLCLLGGMWPRKNVNITRLKERNAQLFSVILIFKSPHCYFGGGEGWRVRGLGRCGEMVHLALVLSLTSK